MLLDVTNFRAEIFLLCHFSFAAVSEMSEHDFCLFVWRFW